ncbi:FAD-dependent oxidoreductase [Methylorubrum rhodesianum]|uniref:FAD-dependent oxidoreductase n=1 Tax=Methylorubrum TaxID=2282523 RepID=UPI0028151C61|nr:FAD-dependent oxidoreductase [Methylorubrum sp. DB1722]
MDVAVIGAGAAGLAAARQLAERRPALRVVVLEAADHPGGWAQTVDRPEIAAPLDLGCGCLHGAEHNPWLPITKHLGLHSAFHEVNWELSRPEDFETAARFVRPDDMHACVRISHDLGRHAAWLAQLTELGFAEIIIHQVGAGQESFIEAFGRKVLPQIAR